MVAKQDYDQAWLLHVAVLLVIELYYKVKH